MIRKLTEIDQDLFLFLNGMHNDLFDQVMFFLSQKLVWIPLYAFLMFLLIRKFRKQFWKVLIMIVLLISLSDLSSVHLFKNVFRRERPCHNEMLMDSIHLVKGKCGGRYGFVSSHAANTFALAVFLSLVFGKKNKTTGMFLILWAILVSYSRIYLGVHYPADVFCGALLGALWAVFLYSFYKSLVKRGLIRITIPEKV